jgi:phospholipase D1/2
VEGFEESLGLGQGSTRLYATVDLGRARVGRTRVITGDPVNPRWYEAFHIYCAHFASDVVFSVKAAQPIGATLYIYIEREREREREVYRYRYKLY